MYSTPEIILGIFILAIILLEGRKVYRRMKVPKNELRLQWHETSMANERLQMAIEESDVWNDMACPDTRTTFAQYHQELKIRHSEEFTTKKYKKLKKKKMSGGEIGRLLVQLRVEQIKMNGIEEMLVENIFPTFGKN